MNKDNILKESLKLEKLYNINKKKLFKKYLEKLSLQIIMQSKILNNIIKKLSLKNKSNLFPSKKKLEKFNTFQFKSTNSS